MAISPTTQNLLHGNIPAEQTDTSANVYNWSIVAALILLSRHPANKAEAEKTLELAAQ